MWARTCECGRLQRLECVGAHWKLQPPLTEIVAAGAALDRSCPLVFIATESSKSCSLSCVHSSCPPPGVRCVCGACVLHVCGMYVCMVHVCVVLLHPSLNFSSG